MGNVFEEKGYRGLKYYCSEKQWKEHVVNEITGHPIMKNNIPAIIETVKSPDYVYESHDSTPDNYREVYSKKVESATYYNNKRPFTKVVVAIAGGSGEIITTFPAKDPEQGTKGEAIYDATSKS